MAQVSSVIGLSTLREQEAPVPKSEKALRLEAYLKKYSDGGDGAPDKKKKKKKKRQALLGAGVKVHDEDVQWQVAKKVVDFDDDMDDGAPVITNLAEAEHEVKLMKQAERYKDSWSTVDVPSSRAETARTPAGPSKRARHDSDDDASPPRRSARRHDTDDDDDASPPRRRADVGRGAGAAHGTATTSGRAGDDDASPPRRRARRHDSDDDASPPRRPERTAVPSGGRSSVAEPPQQYAAAGRRAARHDSDDDASPPRRQGKRHDSDSDASPPRRDARVGDDAAPAQGGRSDGARGAAAERPRAATAAGTAARMADGTSAGVVSAEQLGRELRAKRETERERIMQMAASESGRGAETTYRVGGKVVRKEEFEADMNAKLDAKRKKPKYVEEDTEWKHGLAQQRAATAEAAAMQREAGKKFHREFDDDADADLKRELRADDPMAAYISSKGPDPALQSALPSHANLTSASGFAVPQEIPPHSWLKRRVQPPPNRYNIKPGRHWDGVVRGGKFEVFLFQHRNEKRAYERDAYVYAEDY